MSKPCKGSQRQKKAKEKKVAAKHTSSGKIDKRTKEHKGICANFAKARKKKRKFYLIVSKKITQISF